MLSESQYNEIIKYKEALEMFQIQGTWVGGDEPFYIHERITGEPRQSCGSCKGKKLIDLINMVKMYESK